MWYCTVGELKESLRDVPDDIPVVVPAPDHSYREVLARGVVDVEYDHYNHYLGEYIGQLLEQNSKVIKAFVIE